MKLYIATLVSMLTLCFTGLAQADYADYVLSTNPTIYWQFEETEFTNYSDTNVAVDAASLGGTNNGIGAAIGTEILGPETGGIGVVGNAAVFTKGPGQYGGGHGIEFSGLNTVAGVGANNYSIQLWIKSDLEVKDGATSDELHFFFSRSQDSDPDLSTSTDEGKIERPDMLCYSAFGRDPMARFVSYDGGSASADADADTGTTPTDLSGTSDASAMGWHHLVMTRSSNDDVAVYLDGVLEISVLGDTLDASYIGDCLLVGNRAEYEINGFYGFTGLIDEVAVWNSVLTPTQVASLYSELPEAPEPIPGDANNDQKVDGSDVTILAGNWQVGVDGTVEATWEMGDFNGDKKVDGSDVTILAGNWQHGVSATAASVPEPCTLVMLLALAGGFLAWRRR